MPELNESIKEYEPEERPPLETPTPEGEVPPAQPTPEVEVPPELEAEFEKEVEKAVDEALTEGEVTPPETATQKPDWEKLYQNEQQRYDNLMKLAGRWGQELGQVRDKAKALEPPPPPLNPEQAYEEFQRDPQGFIHRQASQVVQQQAQVILNPRIEALNFLVSHQQWLENGKFKPEIQRVVEEVEAERPWLTDMENPVPNRFEIYDALISSKLLQKNINQEIEKSKKSMSEQQQRTLLAKKNAKLAPVVGGKQTTKSLKDMTLDEMEKTLPHTDRPLG